ncbi:hypothetical protein CC85DRAFT_299011 [Cutaneotrichosporon oleaginosum]|uniref:Uncharacterized protein n=1 Tax=Cutaneotrichosporon oleaginosum TaxID=879819 RepID=A0A0J0XXL1_9TREE|nr:uncharacterized protein CC85DRAFT_299011 [Cutaneotrichosporon oleaginosum]KLT45815.1 hypothetical protein CC85DRAFT_299011 [Cutaneotrichosporon oleaginosum]TXT06522.1 hypothetical protein COLE_05853 [Cutaneotrichosporon oleaginosum]
MVAITRYRTRQTGHHAPERRIEKLTTTTKPQLITSAVAVATTKSATTPGTIVVSRAVTPIKSNSKTGATVSSKPAPGRTTLPTPRTSTIIKSTTLPDTFDTLANPTSSLPSGPTFPVLVDTATSPPPHRTDGFPWGQSRTRPGVIAGATVGSVLGAALIALGALWYARRMAWCFVREGSRAHTPIEHFETVELRSRPGSVIPHYPHSTEDLRESCRGDDGHGESSGQPHTYLNVPRHLHVSPSPPGTPESLAANTNGRLDPWAIRPRSAPPSPSAPPRSASNDDDAIKPFRLDSSDGADSVRPPSPHTPTIPGPTHGAARPQYATTTHRLGSRPVSLLDKAAEMGIESPGLTQSNASPKQYSVPGTPRQGSSAQATGHDDSWHW